MVENLPISDQEKRQILEGNARRLFGLDSAASA
jgi:predicted TIM-barrel fold metal-dependent hydrolase